MKEKPAILLCIFGVFEIVYYLIYQPKTELILGFVINGWLFVSIWAIITLFSAYSFIKANKKKQI